MNILNENNSLVDAKYLEEIFSSLQIKENVPKNLKSIQKVLNASFEGTCLDVTLTTDSTELFGMCVYPATDSLDKIALMVTSGADSKEITKYISSNKVEYVIEIDGNLLYNKFYEFTPDELVAILLHEIGHVVADTDFYNDLAEAYKNAMYEMDNNKDKFADYRYNRKDILLASVYVMSAITNTQIMNKNPKDIMKEQIADSFVIKNGYKDSLLSALDKFSKIYLNKYKHYNSSDVDNIIDLDAKACINLSVAFDRRKQYIDNTLGAEQKLSNCKIMKKFLSDIRVFLKDHKVSGGMIFNKSTNMQLTEGFLERFMRNPISVSQLDIDELKISAEMMDDWDDKSILVYKIHKRLSQLEKCKLNLEKKEQIALVDAYIKQLNELLAQVMKFKHVDKVYGVFIKYPKGYEG